MSDGSLPPISDTRTLAKYLNLAEITLKKWRLGGVGPEWVRCGRAVRYRAEDVESWLAAKTVSNTAQG